MRISDWSSDVCSSDLNSLIRAKSYIEGEAERDEHPDDKQDLPPAAGSRCRGDDGRRDHQPTIDPRLPADAGLARNGRAPVEGGEPCAERHQHAALACLRRRRSEEGCALQGDPRGLRSPPPRRTTPAENETRRITRTQPTPAPTPP